MQREPSWQAALIFCPPCRLPGKLSDEGVGYMAELQDVEWNSDTKGEDKSSVLSLGPGVGGHMGGGMVAAGTHPETVVGLGERK